MKRPETLSREMLSLARQLYMHPSLDREIATIPELEGFEVIDCKHEKRLAFIISLVKVSLDEIREPEDSEIEELYNKYGYSYH